jgi:hypothetical protein
LDCPSIGYINDLIATCDAEDKEGLGVKPPELSEMSLHMGIDQICLLSSRSHVVGDFKAVAIQGTVQPQHHAKTSVATKECQQAIPLRKRFEIVPQASKSLSDERLRKVTDWISNCCSSHPAPLCLTTSPTDLSQQGSSNFAVMATKF